MILVLHKFHTVHLWNHPHARKYIKTGEEETRLVLYGSSVGVFTQKSSTTKRHFYKEKYSLEKYLHVMSVLNRKHVPPVRILTTLQKKMINKKCVHWAKS